MTGYPEPPYFGFLRGRSPVLATACQLFFFCLNCVMVIKIAISFVIIMNIVTIVSVSSRGHYGDGFKFPPQLPFKCLKSRLMVHSPLKLRERSENERSDQFDF